MQDLHLEFSARRREIDIAIESGEFARADTALERVQAIAEQTRQPTHRWLAGFKAAALTCMRGELDARERLAEQALQIGQEASEPDALMYYGVILVQNRVLQGGRRGDRADRADGGQLPAEAAWEAALGHAYCLSDRQPEWAEVLARAAAKGFEHVRYDAARMTALALYADTATQTGAVEAAAMLYELLEPYADQFDWDGAASSGHARLYLALLAETLGRHEQADAHFALACEFHREHGYGAFEPRAVAILDVGVSGV